MHINSEKKILQINILQIKVEIVLKLIAIFARV